MTTLMAIRAHLRTRVSRTGIFETNTAWPLNFFFSRSIEQVVCAVQVLLINEKGVRKKQISCSERNEGE